MISRSAFWQAIAVTGFCASLTGCAPASVKDVVADKFGYLDSEFSNDKISSSVTASMTKLDPTSVGFRKMVLNVDYQYESQSNPSFKPSYQETLTFVNAGNGLVRSLDERSQNGIPVIQTYDLSYRNMLTLRSQQVNLNSTISNFVMETKSLSRVDSAAPSAAGGTFEFDGETARTMQIANFSSWKRICSWGATHPATDLSPKLAGKAQDLDCQNLNQNGVQVNRVHAAYLVSYGVMVVQQIEIANAKGTFTLKDIQVE